jgi:hypothetical protein
VLSSHPKLHTPSGCRLTDEMRCPFYKNGVLSNALVTFGLPLNLACSTRSMADVLSR